MNFKALIFTIVLAVSSLCAMAQTKRVHLLTIQQLNKRISNPDTVYIVNFWATWCGPCVKELPNFDQLQQAYKKKPVKVLLVSMDFKSKLNDVKTFTNQNKIVSEVYLADKPNDQEFIDQIDKKWSGALPGTLIVDAKKHIHQFYEREFTFAELDKLYQAN